MQKTDMRNASAEEQKAALQEAQENVRDPNDLTSCLRTIKRHAETPRAALTSMVTMMALHLKANGYGEAGFLLFEQLEKVNKNTNFDGAVDVFSRG